ncbi:MAG: protein-export chaperone SecB [Flavobacteriaceae bacterium]
MAKKPTETNGGAAAEAPAAAQQAPQINVLGQFIKDLSFENPNAPQSFIRKPEKAPPLNVQINVNARPLSETDFMVELMLEAKAGEDKDILFNIELVYAGIFRLQNTTQDQIHPLVMIECPRLLFPFARQIIADATQQGGFAPMLLDPIDFVSLYRKRAQEQQAQA